MTADPGSEAGIAAAVEDWVAAEQCDLIIGVGGPQQRFAVIDHVFPGDPANAASVVFRTDQAAFLTGYVAAATSRTQKVAT